MNSLVFDIPKNVKNILSFLEDKGYESYIVGGCVRDMIMGRDPHDWDICTSALPEKVESLFRGQGYTVVPTGIQHGTVTVIIEQEGYEITTFRIDGKYSDSRRPDTVEFTEDIKEDLSRRDFTMNAIAFNPNRGLIDPFHGQRDIQDKIIACVGSAKERFKEDALRILRAIRFASRFGFSLESHVYDEVFNQRDNLKSISMERIQSEFCNIMTSSNPANVLLKYKQVFEVFLPELKDMDMEQNNPHHDFTVWGHTLRAVSSCVNADLILRLAVLFHDIGKPHSYQDGTDKRRFKGHPKVSAEMTDKILHRMRFDNDTREQVVELILHHDSEFIPEKKYVRRWLNKIGEVQFQRLLILRTCDIAGQKRMIDPEREEEVKSFNIIRHIMHDILNDKECFSLKSLAVNGDTIMKTFNLPAGKEIGYWLNKVLDKVIEGDLNNTEEEILDWIRGEMVEISVHEVKKS